MVLALSFNPSTTSGYEVGVDEVGRGPMFGRVYVAAVVLPKCDTFDYSSIKDSKKFTSRKKIKCVSDYIKSNALAYSVKHLDADVIDKINIREATLSCMKLVLDDVCSRFITHELFLLIDGNDFRPYMFYDNHHQLYKHIPHVTVKGGDNAYASIAAASILAKVARDEYIDDLVQKHPRLQECYDLANNKGYGTTKHLHGIATHGLSPWHRKSFGICKTTHNSSELF